MYIPWEGEHMDTTPRKSQKLVDIFLRSTSPVQANTLGDVARHLRLRHRGGSIGLMETALQKAYRGKRVFEYIKEGQNFYESKPALRKRKRVTAAKKPSSSQELAVPDSTSSAPA